MRYIIRVSGRVQGVGFRYYTHRTALKHNINGFVKNMLDGSVYIEAEGDQGEIATFISWCRKGPGFARVTHIDISEQKISGHIGFQIR